MGLAQPLKCLLVDVYTHYERCWVQTYRDPRTLALVMHSRPD